ncbi:hypothetical protein [Mangrovimonas cancribranchiae]|uniref:Uncharacterized protein n=1 Tax=Mangrovimonas cancribranchiae TaxID=3080055 RepID=A0AAU6NXX6_9FLAO
MSALNNLINQKVVATIEGEDNEYQIEGIVTGVDVNDFYFHEKGEPIYISVSLNPNEDLPKEIDMEEMMEIPLDRIRKV